jgi:hypothetical protein
VPGHQSSARHENDTEDVVDITFEGDTVKRTEDEVRGIRRRRMKEKKVTGRCMVSGRV